MRRTTTAGNAGWRTMLILFASLVMLGSNGTCAGPSGPDPWDHHRGSGSEEYDASVRFTDEPHTLLPGMTYRTVFLDAPLWKNCKNLCRRDRHCRAYTYANPGIDHPIRASCRLKHGVPAPVINGCCHSGVKRH